MILLTFRDLVYRKTRFIVVTLLAAVVFVILLISALAARYVKVGPNQAVKSLNAAAAVANRWSIGLPLAARLCFRSARSTRPSY